LCHIDNFESHLKQVCSSTSHVILETAVCDSEDPYKCVIIAENKGNYDMSFNGNGSRPTAAAVERIFKECGMDFRRIDSDKFNSGPYKYDWKEKNNGECNVNNRRIWFAVSSNSKVKFNPPPQYVPVKPTNPPLLINNPQFKAITTTKKVFYPNLKPSDRKFVIVIPSYNNSKWCIKNIESVINQSYNNYRIIFTDDCSNDGTFEIVAARAMASPKADRITLVKNTTRLGALANLYNMIHSCDDDEIILTLDGDDWLPDDQVLNKLFKHYSDENIWMTYGQYQNFPDGQRGVADSYPTNVIDTNSFRSYKWGASHLRTFYTWLFKRIKKEDLYHNGKFLEMTWDLGIMFPMLEMSGHHSKYLSETLYIYNMTNPINDHKVNRNLQQQLDHAIRKRPKYSLTQKPAFKKTSIGLMCIATGKYFKYVQPFITSADKYFLDNQFNITYYIFTDKDIKIQSNRNVVIIPIEHRPFPFASMDRFKHFSNNAEKFNTEDYLYYCDVDCLFVDSISTEILGDLVGVRHCGYFNTPGPYEINPQSSLFANHSQYKHYFGGGFSGGSKDKYLELSKWCKEMIDKDVANNIMPIWHDETAINRYFLDNEPTVILSPSYHYPQSNIEVYKKKWAPNVFKPKIMLLDKNHQDIRS
jgi:glycosyltransferase involved in cell wall biosynthesis